MKLYLAGPMRNRPALNHPAFMTAAAALRASGHTVFNPAEQGVSATIADIRAFLGADLAWITSEAEGLVMLPGWEQSLGASAEAATAWALVLPVWEFGPFIQHGRDAVQLAAPQHSAPAVT